MSRTVYQCVFLQLNEGKREGEGVDRVFIALLGGVDAPSLSYIYINLFLKLFSYSIPCFTLTTCSSSGVEGKGGFVLPTSWVRKLSGSAKITWVSYLKKWGGWTHVISRVPSSSAVLWHYFSDFPEVTRCFMVEIPFKSRPLSATRFLLLQTLHCMFNHL